MPALFETQALILGSLFGRHDGAAVASLLRRSAPGLPALRRLQIYRNNFNEGLGDALQAVYPVLARLVGDHYFRQLSRGFIAAHPLRSGSLHDFGRELPDHIAQRPELARLPYLDDVARLEWACHEVYHEAEHLALAPTQLAKLSPEAQVQLRLPLAPATRFLASRYPVLRIWASNQPAATEAAAPVSLDEGGVRVLIARRDGDVEFRVLGEAEDLWLRALAAGATLAEATASAVALAADFDLGGVLGRHLSLGTFAQIPPGESP
ncbi:MAG: DNA-binding domain-containing protein [Burkholderiaceae bacterium]